MMELPAMSEALLEDKYRSDWEPVVNLDVFFSGMYTYFYHRGLYPIIITQICAVLSLGFTVAFSVFLIAYVNWTELSKCHDELSCQDIDSYIYPHPFFHSVFGVICFSYLLLFSAYWLWRCVSAVQVISQANDMERFYREKLSISQADIENIRWHEVLDKLVRLHEQGVYRVAVSEQLTEHDVVSRILRKENFMVALINKTVLNLRLPWWVDHLLGPPSPPPDSISGDRLGMVPSQSQSLFLTKSLEWSLYFCILQYMFDERFAVSSQFLRDTAGLQKRFMVVGAVHVILLPFLLLFMVIHFFLQNAQQFHSSRAYLGPRQWSPLALWTFREFNELPHIFEQRMNASLEPASTYLNSFHNASAAALARFVVYISGSVVAAILLCSVLGDGILLYVRVGDHNLLFLLGVFSAILAAARSLIPDETQKKLSQEELLEKVAANTHYMPSHWEHMAHTNQVKNEVSELFPFKAKVFAMEILSVGLTPLVLLFSLPQSAKTILQFLKDHTVYVEGLGSVCDYSRFDLAQYGDMKYGAPVMGSLPERKRPTGPKLEQSVLNFSIHHPHWLNQQSDATGQGGQQFLSRMLTYKNQIQMSRDALVASVLLSQTAQPQSMFNRHPSEKEGGNTCQYQGSRQSQSEKEQMKNQRPQSHVSGSMKRTDLAMSLDNNQTLRSETIECMKSSTSSPSHAPTKGLSDNSVKALPQEITGSMEADVSSETVTEERQRSKTLNQNLLTINTDTTQSLEPGRLEDSFTLGSPPLAPPDLPLPFQYRDPHVRSIDRSLLSDLGLRLHRTQSDNTGPIALESSHSPNMYGSSVLESPSSSSSMADFRLARSQHRSGHFTDMSASNISRQTGTLGGANVPSVLRSVLQAEDIDFENDFYWLMKFQQDRARDPVAMEKSLGMSLYRENTPL